MQASTGSAAVVSWWTVAGCPLIAVVTRQARRAERAVAAGARSGWAGVGRCAGPVVRACLLRSGSTAGGRGGWEAMAAQGFPIGARYAFCMVQRYAHFSFHCYFKKSHHYASQDRTLLRAAIMSRTEPQRTLGGRIQRHSANRHHTSQLADLGRPGPGQPAWAALMAKMRRKTLIVCAACHEHIHATPVANAA